jgi:hypothetical protein
MQNLRALGEVSAKANHDAQSWLRSRSGASSPALTELSVWEKSSQSIASMHSRWQSCVVFWERFRQFLLLIQWPQNTAQMELVRNLQLLLEKDKCLSVGLLIRWLHQCGPPLCKVRENFRVLSFVRCTLGVSHCGLQSWCKLPAIKSKGFTLESME